MSSKRWRFACVISMVAGCGSSPPGPGGPTVAAPPPVAAPAPAPAPAPEAALTPPTLRLPALARPTHNTVELTIDPTTEDFTGRITTELDVLTPTPILWLNQTELTVDKATLTVAGGAAQDAVASTPTPGYLALRFAHPLAAGHATLAITYRGKMHKNDGAGIYTAQEAGDWYAFTQFENTDARRAFPTFDEPAYKIPWQLTLHTKATQVALSNTPIERETPEANGMKATRFAETPALPSYLVAFCVGPFDLVDAGKTASGIPIRIVVPRGRGAEAAYPAKVTVPILEALEKYFDLTYPFPKLDMVAVSVFNAGAMENPGLITFRQEIVLTKPAELTKAKEETYASIAAHEMAHQWFGDLVTLAWWDDTWLNESFATWMATKIIVHWKPEWDEDVAAVESKSRVMGADSLDTARAVRQPIESANDIANAFDGITYQKGEAVLTMIEAQVGPDVWQKGVRAYLTTHARGNATYADFVGAMSAAAGTDLKPLFDGFILQSGVPLVSMALTCAKGEPPTLQLAQRRYLPTGSTIDPKRLWQVPVCVRWGVGKATGRDCTTLGGAESTLALTAKTCPDWVLPNAGEVGYYRMLPAPALLSKLLAHTQALTLAERVGVLGDLQALIASGDVQPGVVLGLVGQLAKEKSRHIVSASVGVVARIDELVPDNLRPNYERFIRKLYGARARELGWASKPGESADAKELRPQLLGLVAGDGRDPQLIAQATALAWKWLGDHKAVEPEMVGTVLRVAARYGDQKLFDRLHADAKAATDRADRRRLIGPMGAFTDPKIVPQALALGISGEFDLREGGSLIQGGMSDPRTREVAYQFIKAHFDDILGKLPPMYRVYMAGIAVPLCDASRKPEIEAWLKPKIEPLDGGPRAYAQAIEELDLCSAGRAAQRPAVIAFLKQQ